MRLERAGFPATVSISNNLAMSDSKKQCDLCGLNVEVEGFELKTVEGDKSFCCEGCKGIYLMLHEEQIIQEQAGSENSIDNNP